jgi:N-acyl-D-aspartate/D-glutamate deacylase
MTPSYDLLITGGEVVDGTGAPPFRADVAIQAGRIAAIITAGQLDTQYAIHNIQQLDATGLLIAPGFIDIHSHSDFTLLTDPRAVSSVAQGVTLEVVGNCGHGCAPIAEPALAAANIYGYQAGARLDWRSVAGYLERLEQARPAVNVLTLVPNGCLRLAVTGLVDRPATPDELAQMQRLLAQSLEEGAFGYSTGLEYGPERACPEHEIAALCRVAANAGGLYATHTRNRDGEPVEAIAEAIRASTASGAPLQISHIGVVARLSHDSEYAVEQALAQVALARRNGMDVAFDMHTRLFGTTNLSAALPPWALAGDRAAIAARLRDPAARREMKHYSSIITALARGDWSRIVLFDSRARPELARNSIATICADRGGDPFDAIYDILLDEIDDLHAPMILAFSYREQDMHLILAQPDCMLGSDATALAPDGPLAGMSFHGAYTWAAWFFHHFVRDTRTLTAQEAVRRLTSLPASRLGLHDRGVVRTGARADLAIFDPEIFAERGTTFAPNQTAVGMQHVLVNGGITLRDGVLTGERSGQVLRKA